MTSVDEGRHRLAWASVAWFLFAVWIADAVLVMTHRRAGSFTDHAADLALPPWLYIVLRSTRRSSRSAWRRKLAGAPPLAFAALLFAACVGTEISQYFWPHGLFRGTFDPIDIVAYGVGLGLAALADRRWPIPGEERRAVAGS